MKAQWEYQRPSFSDEPAPFISLIIKNPLREKQIEVNALVDTGYDGFAILSEEKFLSIALDEFEVPYTRKPRAETYGGELIEFRSASAEIIIPAFEVSVLEEVDAIDDAIEVLVGRKFLKLFETLLNGPQGILEVSLPKQY
jgi:clan AA aspartic protease